MKTGIIGCLIALVLRPQFKHQGRTRRLKARRTLVDKQIVFLIPTVGICLGPPNVKPGGGNDHHRPFPELISRGHGANRADLPLTFCLVA